MWPATNERHVECRQFDILSYMKYCSEAIESTLLLGAARGGPSSGWRNAVTDTASQRSTDTTSRVDVSAGTSSRLEEFEADIRRLGVKGGEAEPERRLAILGVLVAVAGFVVAAVALNTVRGADSDLAQGDGLALVILGVGMALVGTVVWARYSLSRYLRYWLVREIFEARTQTDRIVEAIERGN